MSRNMIWTVAPLCLLVAACSEGPVDVGGASVMALTDARDVARVTLTVTAADIGNPIVVNLAQDEDGTWKGILDGIPAGDARAFTLEGFNADDTLIYRGVASPVTVQVGTRANVVITLQEINPAPAFANQIPFIDSMTASAMHVAPSESIMLTVTAHDPNPADTLSFAWTGTGGSFQPADSASTTWNAPTNVGTYRLTVNLTDGRGGSRTLDLDVTVSSASQSGSAGITATVNNAPRDVQVVANPGRVAAGESLTLDAAALDDDGDPLSFQWTDTCDGHFNNYDAEDPTWTAPSQAPSGGTCTLRMTVSDGRGGSNQGEVTVQIGDPETFNTAPTVEISFQSTDSVKTGHKVTLSVTASDPDGDSLTFSWAADAGTFNHQEDEDNSSEVEWRAPSTASSYMITCTVVDEFGAATVRSFTVQATQ